MMSSFFNNSDPLKQDSDWLRDRWTIQRLDTIFKIDQRASRRFRLQPRRTALDRPTKIGYNIQLSVARTTSRRNADDSAHLVK